LKEGLKVKILVFKVPGFITKLLDALAGKNRT